MISVEESTMRNLEKEIFEYLNRKNKPISIQEMCEEQSFDEMTYRKLGRKMLELTLSKAIKRNIDNGIAYYFIEREDEIDDFFDRKLVDEVIETDEHEDEEIESIEIEENIVEQINESSCTENKEMK